LRKADINIVALHNHMIGETPQIFFTHFWGKGKPADLAKGVYESLVNTTMGLFISIVFLTANFFMKNKVSDITLEINNAIGDILARNMAPEAGK